MTNEALDLWREFFSTDYGLGRAVITDRFGRTHCFFCNRDNPVWNGHNDDCIYIRAKELVRGPQFKGMSFPELDNMPIHLRISDTHVVCGLEEDKIKGTVAFSYHIEGVNCPDCAEEIRKNPGVYPSLVDEEVTLDADTFEGLLSTFAEENQ